MEMIMKILTSAMSHRMMNRVSMPAIIAVAASIMAGCASIPAPTGQLAVSKAAVTSATRAGGNEFAPLELKSAVDKMQGAEQAMAANNFPLAKQLAEEAQVDANLAETKTDLAKTQKAVDDSLESNRVLREEINRMTP
jgi:septal ring factor EnvC (AmiA/AmiB activator)